MTKQKKKMLNFAIDNFKNVRLPDKCKTWDDAFTFSKRSGWKLWFIYDSEKVSGTSTFITKDMISKDQ